MEMLRERIKGLEKKIVEMIRNGQDNSVIAERLHRWTRALMITTEAPALPEVLVRELKQQFLIPQAAVRVWGVADAFKGLAVRAGRERRHAQSGHQPRRAVLRRQCRLRGRALARRSCQRGVDGHGAAARRRRRRRLRPAGRRLARPDALQRRHGHRLPAAHRRDRQRRIGALAARVVGAAAPLPDEVLRYLRHLEVERRLAARTLVLYRDALRRLSVAATRGRCRTEGGTDAPRAALDRPGAPARPGAAQPGDRARGVARAVPLVGRAAIGGQQPGRRRAGAQGGQALAQGAVGGPRSGARRPRGRRRRRGAGRARPRHRRAALRLRPARR